MRLGRYSDSLALEDPMEKCTADNGHSSHSSEWLQLAVED
jgi:hypothetical protein